MLTIEQQIKPTLSEPFPNIPRYWKDPKTGIVVPKIQQENVEWRGNLLQRAEKDIVLQNDLLAASKESLLFWVNAFAWTFHQFDVNEEGKRIESINPHVPFITWEIQDELFNDFEYHLKHALDILIDKSRDMGASWMCVDFLHWLWLFRPNSQLLEMSRVEGYVDQTGNMKALFQKHDYINKWLPEWMCPPMCMPGEKYRTKMHMGNVLNGCVIDGESTTVHAASGDRRLIALLDEFAKVENGKLMWSATRDAALMRMINSTPAGAGTEYSIRKNSGQIKVFILPFWKHPDKGRGRYIKQTDTGEYEIRSPWFDYEETVRSPQELAREILRQDVESGDVFFKIHNIDKHIAMFVEEPKSRWNIGLKKGIAKEAIPDLIHKRDNSIVQAMKMSGGKLKVWTHLILGRPDQTKSYIMGIDLSKGQGASESVVSIKCKETGQKIAEWRCANTPPYDMVYTVIALALWVGGARPNRLPFTVWEDNGPGWDFGKIFVKELHYPFFYRRSTPGKITDKKTDKYGYHMSQQSKYELLSLYDERLAHGGYYNPSAKALEQAKQYIHFSDGGIGPACLIEENASARKTHGDIVIADALTLLDKEIPKRKFPQDVIPKNSIGYRFQQFKKSKLRPKGWRKVFDFAKGIN